LCGTSLLFICSNKWVGELFVICENVHFKLLNFWIDQNKSHDVDDDDDVDDNDNYNDNNDVVDNMTKKIIIFIQWLTEINKWK